LRAPHPVVELPQAQNVLPWLDADSHLIAIVGPRIGKAMHRRAHEAAQDAAIPRNRLCTIVICLFAV